MQFYFLIKLIKCLSGLMTLESAFNPYVYADGVIMLNESIFILFTVLIIYCKLNLLVCLFHIQLLTFKGAVKKCIIFAAFQPKHAAFHCNIKEALNSVLLMVMFIIK